MGRADEGCRSSGALGLSASAAHVFNRRDRVSPGDVIGRNAQGGGQTLTLRRAGGVVAPDDGANQFPVQSRGRDELVGTDAGLFDVACDRFHGRCQLITLLSSTVTLKLLWPEIPVRAVL